MEINSDGESNEIMSFVICLMNLIEEPQAAQHLLPHRAFSSCLRGIASGQV